MLCFQYFLFFGLIFNINVFFCFFSLHIYNRLRDLGLSHLYNVFVDQQCYSLKSISTVTEKDLESFGIKSVPKRLIFASIKSLAATWDEDDDTIEMKSIGSYKGPINTPEKSHDTMSIITTPTAPKISVSLLESISYTNKPFSSNKQKDTISSYSQPSSQSSLESNDSTSDSDSTSDCTSDSTSDYTCVSTFTVPESLIIKVPFDCRTVADAVTIARRSKKYCSILITSLSESAKEEKNDESAKEKKNTWNQQNQSNQQNQWNQRNRQDNQNEIDIGISQDLTPDGKCLKRMGMSDLFTGIYVNFPLKIYGQGAKQTLLRGTIQIDSNHAKDVVLEGISLVGGGLVVSRGAQLLVTKCHFEESLVGAKIIGCGKSQEQKDVQQQLIQQQQPNAQLQSQQSNEHQYCTEGSEMVENETKVNFLGCSFLNCQKVGILAKDYAFVTLSDCNVSNNVEYGLSSETNSVIHLRGGKNVTTQNGTSVDKWSNTNITTNGKIYIHQ